MDRDKPSRFTRSCSADNGLNLSVSRRLEVPIQLMMRLNCETSSFL